MHHAHADFDWNDETIGRLRALWAEVIRPPKSAAASAPARTPLLENRTGSSWKLGRRRSEETARDRPRALVVHAAQVLQTCRAPCDQPRHCGPRRSKPS